MSEIPENQRLINIMFEIAIRARDLPKSWTNDQIAAWVRRQLKECGFNTQPMGASWGELVK